MTPPHPPLRSFQPRRRKLGPTRRASYERLREVWCFAVEGPELQWAQGAILDIGFGYGAALIELADRERGQRVLGVEVHTPGVAHVLDAIEEHGFDHVRVVEGDVLDVLGRIGPGVLAGIRIWFPDPWPKAHQQRRRIVRPDVISALIDRLGAGGFVHLATDVADYAEQMQRVCDADDRLVGGQVTRPDWRPITGYERRAVAAGRVSIDLMYRRL